MVWNDAAYSRPPGSLKNCSAIPFARQARIAPSTPRHIGLAQARNGARHLASEQFGHPGMGQNAIVVVEQEGHPGSRQLLPLQHLLRRVHQEVAGDHAAAALFQGD